MRFRIPSLLMVLLLVGCSSLSVSPPLTTEQHWVSETLPNGFRYHLYPIEGQDVELRLIVNVGSLNEREEERGYAHFIEHMAFNGTTHFPNNSVFKTFAAVGVQFGPDINAVTDYGRTVYQLSLPDDEKLDDALRWFRDIGDGITLDEQAVKDEIAVIFGEWRLDNKAQSSWQLQVYDDVLNGTPYIERDPIGTEQTLTKANAESLSRFYKKWYSANRMQLIVVGDMNAPALQQVIHQDFASLPTESAFPERHTLPDVGEAFQYPLTVFGQQGQSPAIVVNIKEGRYMPASTLKEQRMRWLDWMVTDAIQLRLNEQLDRRAINNNGVYSNVSFVPGWNVYEFTVDHNQQVRDDVLDAVARDFASLRDKGIGESEFQLLFEQYQNIDFSMDSYSSLDNAENAVSNLYINRLPQDAFEENDNFQRFLETLSREDINARLDELLSPSNMSLTIAYGRGESLASADALKRAFFDAVAQTGEALRIEYKQVQIPQPTTTVRERSAPIAVARDLYQWSLPNGVQTTFYQMDDGTGYSHVVLQAKGGLSSLTRRERAAVDMLYETYRRGDVDGIDLNDFYHHLDGLSASIVPSVYSTAHNIALSTSSDTLAESLNALRLMIEHIIPDEEAFYREKSRLLARLNSVKSSPYDEFERASLQLMYPDDSYESRLNLEDYERLTFTDVVDVYQRLFADLGDMKIYVASDLPPSVIQQLTGKYLGGLTTHRAPSDSSSPTLRTKGGRVVVATSPEYRTYIEKIYVLNVEERNVEQFFAEDMLNRVMQARYNAIMRERHGFDYDPYFSAWTWDGQKVLVATFTALIDPMREDELQRRWPAIQAELIRPVTQQEKNNAGVQLTREINSMARDSHRVVGALARYGIWGYDIKGLLDPESVVKQISVDRLNALAASMFAAETQFENILRPAPEVTPTK
ncbi:M16 family metallopeptidase [Enterovibrio baiacu]|uniref:M16 family metallopeptidase n=1 Tax=Enterovibrio baiacu TaxID=2491023 RepID=UPI001012C1D0|nr:M16 family metallopeptidase [Enterovibrio baiacu]MBE1276604.1 insulinase family protein [Enterovibrio baiacu]